MLKIHNLYTSKVDNMAANRSLTKEYKIVNTVTLNLKRKCSRKTEIAAKA